MEQQILEGVRRFMEGIPFNRFLGVELMELEIDKVVLKVPMRDELVGNYIHGILHGGVITSVLDVAGGCVALTGAFSRLNGEPTNEEMQAISKLGTIDLRVDFLRPGRGEWFLASACPLRTGNKVAVTRMEFHNDRGDLLAVGTGTYLCG
ncbi:thioesterase family protein [Acanthopleuribacter pedis]|uniref:Medium/long-chain acyl-CoA thioesterase YigI n=1 Tax=Acanthopleuribacter pedis TaxID=442870 RepID=A0A8J7QA61_9BACT|nr:thioesterase family protein [Acanthopleuribacter pedis]MBO1321631.1 thioesterase family protein [Acanthopleuribacter pedis]